MGIPGAAAVEHISNRFFERFRRDLDIKSEATGSKLERAHDSELISSHCSLRKAGM